jgi:translation initiation factor 1
MAKKSSAEYRVVYSTDGGSVCPECGAFTKECQCAARKQSSVLGDGNVRIKRETKGRAGKTVSTVSGIALSEEPLKELLAQLKRVCGCGGSIKDGVLEIQGDHCDLLQSELAKRGITAKRSGG